MLHHIARATLASLALSFVSTAPALAQDCWLPDAFEPNDVVPTPIGVGLHTRLALNITGLGTSIDVDRFLITIPPRLRLTVDFSYESTPGNLSSEQFPIRGVIDSQDGSVDPRGYRAVGDDTDISAFYDNPHAHPLNVVVDASIDWNSFVGCRRYDLFVALSARPCDTLPDDALEGPDDCGTGSVLLPGLHEDLIVFSELRAAGRDVDYYRILDVQPGNAFEIHALAPDGSPLPIRMEVHEDASCTTAGGRLRAEGSDVALNDDLVLQVAGFPAHGTGIVFHDSAIGGSRRGFQDGLLCVGSGSTPLWFFAVDSTGLWTAPGPAPSALAALGTSPSRSHFQAWYRDARGPCGSGSNTTNAIRVE